MSHGITPVALDNADDHRKLAELTANHTPQELLRALAEIYYDAAKSSNDSRYDYLAEAVSELATAIDENLAE